MSICITMALYVVIIRPFKREVAPARLRRIVYFILIIILLLSSPSRDEITGAAAANCNHCSCQLSTMAE